jgi:hypothetical protein
LDSPTDIRPARACLQLEALLGEQAHTPTLPTRRLLRELAPGDRGALVGEQSHQGRLRPVCQPPLGERDRGAPGRVTQAVRQNVTLPHPESRA